MKEILGELSLLGQDITFPEATPSMAASPTVLDLLVCDDMSSCP